MKNNSHFSKICSEKDVKIDTALHVVVKHQPSVRAPSVKTGATPSPTCYVSL